MRAITGKAILDRTRCTTHAPGRTPGCTPGPRGPWWLGGREGGREEAAESCAYDDKRRAEKVCVMCACASDVHCGFRDHVFVAMGGERTRAHEPKSTAAWARGLARRRWPFFPFQPMRELEQISILQRSKRRVSLSLSLSLSLVAKSNEFRSFALFFLLFVCVRVFVCVCVCVVGGEGERAGALAGKKSHGGSLYKEAVEREKCGARARTSARDTPSVCFFAPSRTSRTRAPPRDASSEGPPFRPLFFFPAAKKK
jgi:hypothetical protein